MAIRDWSRRDFMHAAAGASALLAGRQALARPELLAQLLATQEELSPLAELLRTAPRARYWVSAATAKTPADCASCHSPEQYAAEPEHAHKTKTVRCLLCAQSCLIGDGGRGKCRVRFNAGGELRTLSYGRPISVHVDPIEKKPLYHFLPGRTAYSLSTAGCPLRCKFCQNWEISQARPEDHDLTMVPPERIVRAAIGRKAPVIAFTYNEPTVFTEYLTDIARLARPRKIRSVLVSCGFMNEDPLTEMCEVLDAIKIAVELGVLVGITNLIVPTLNDDLNLIGEMCGWIKSTLGPDVPLHFSRFHPQYRLQKLPPTPLETLRRAHRIALDHGLRYVYTGNVPHDETSNTFCPRCRLLLIARLGYFVKVNRVSDGRCPQCGFAIAGIWT
jgi:pyruvate formate lyase activating enzyme